MYNSKKAQISDTISWMIATIIIVIILLASILLSNLSLSGTNTISSSRLQDVVATKSISSYLYKNYEGVIKKELIGGENANFPVIENSLFPFLISLARDDVEGWNIAFFIDGQSIYQKNFYTSATSPQRFENSFYFDNQKIRIKFWREGAYD
jgi:hypothetical protein